MVQLTLTGLALGGATTLGMCFLSAVAVAPETVVGYTGTPAVVGVGLVIALSAASLFSRAKTTDEADASS
ncbi:hypothetical protein ACNS7O_05790 [Haloferacaceae archaeon DSL9]